MSEELPGQGPLERQVRPQTSNSLTMALAEALQSCLVTLQTLQCEDFEDGGAALKHLIDRSALLVWEVKHSESPVSLGPRQRLWVVRVVREAYVLATDEEGALAQQREIERWEDSPRVTAEPAEGQHLDGWDAEPSLCLVYGTDKDISLTAARALVSGA